jgi:hypothetical protein
MYEIASRSQIVCRLIHRTALASHLLTSALAQPSHPIPPRHFALYQDSFPTNHILVATTPSLRTDVQCLLHLTRPCHPQPRSQHCEISEADVVGYVVPDIRNKGVAQLDA